jgi:2-oxoglutarate dehydrogenase E1 component
VMDQFISSGESKWGRVCGLVQFLPHGYEGQGPEHSSARLERYLQLCAEHNIQVCVPSTAAQVFHLLRRQMLRPFRKPLVVMTPKSLLRKKEASSAIDELANGTFQTVIPELEPLEPKDIRRVIACCGKVYYDLAQKRNETKRSDVAIIRVEQLYPFPHKQFEAQMKRYPGATEVIWCQEEPQNQGAWYQTAHYFRENMRDDQKLHYAGRAPSAAPASGYAARHTETQKALVEQAFAKYK